MKLRSQSLLATCLALTVLAALLACKKTHAPAQSEAASSAQSFDSSPPAASSGSSPAKELYAVGERAEAPDYALTVENIKECKTKYYSAPKKGNMKLGVEVLFEGLVEKEVSVNPFYARIVDSEGYSYSTTFGGCEPSLNVVRIAKGEKAKGWITFELPAKARGLKLTYSPITFGPKQDVSIDLGR